MKKRLLAALLAAVLTLGLAPAALAAPAGAFEITVTGEQRYAYAYEVAEQVNALRASLGLEALVVDEALMDTAMRRAAECSVYYSHTRPDDTRCFTVFPAGRTPTAENIAAGYASPDAVMAAWTGSEAHYKNMTDPAMTAIGVGCFYVGGVCFWVQALSGGGTPAAGGTRADQTASVTVPVAAAHLSASMAPEDLDLTLTVGERKKLTVYANNQGYSYAKTPIDNFSRKSLAGGEKIASFDGDAMTLTAAAPGTATLTLSLPGGGFRIKLTVLDPETGFCDVSSASDWFAADVKYAVERGMMKGTGGSAFSPKKTITRAEVLTALARLEGADVEPEAGAPWYQKAVDWGVRREISDGSKPGGTITREELVVMLYRLEGRPEADLSALERFSDAAGIDGWKDFPQAMAWAAANGIVKGSGDGRLNPRGTASRAEAASIFRNFCALEKGE